MSTVSIENIRNIHLPSSTVADKFIISIIKSLIHSSTTLIGIVTGRIALPAKTASDRFVHGTSTRAKWESFIALAPPSAVTRDCLTNETELPSPGQS